MAGRSRDAALEWPLAIYGTKHYATGSSWAQLWDKTGHIHDGSEEQWLLYLRKSAFVLQKHSTVQFNLKMWVCPTDVEFIQYIEFEEVPRTHLKPLVLYAKKELQGELQRFRGPNAFADLTGHPRQYPAIFTFNLLTVQAEEIVYDPTKHLLNAIGNVHWQDANNPVSP